MPKRTPMPGQPIFKPNWPEPEERGPDCRDYEPTGIIFKVPGCKWSAECRTFRDDPMRHLFHGAQRLCSGFKIPDRPPAPSAPPKGAK